MAFRRIQHELADFEEHFGGTNIRVRPVSEKGLFIWDAVIFGPDGTPYENGIFHLKIFFPMSRLPI